MLGALLCGAALATPGPFSDAPTDPAARLIDRKGRAQGADLIYGARGLGTIDIARRLGRIETTEPLLSGVLGPELSGMEAPGLQWWGRHRWLGAAGDVQPMLQGGDTEPGLGSLRAGADVYARWGMATLYARPEAGVDAGGEIGAVPRLGVPEAWVGLQTPAWQVGFGRVDRWLGPGRHGGLMLTDNAAPAPLGSVAWEDRLGEHWGRLRIEVGAGWLDQPRTDVARPGWLLADLRWAPVPMFEAGATRMGIFGGQGRPAPRLGQLLIPTDPHVEGDPEQLLPDQDEIAALDGRLTLPLGDWLQGPVDYAELYIQYGGEDVIGREIVGIPVPSLAGVANLYGVELGAGPMVFDLEHARVLDDRFRWYTGHRIYHEGFTQAGQVMGHPEGGDSHSTHVSARWFPGEWGAEVSYARVLRVGITAIEGDNLQALMADTSIDRVGLRGWYLMDGRRWLHVSAALVRTANPDFLPGPSEYGWRVAIGN